MKTIIEDYYKEFKRYFQKIRKKSKKFYRKLKYIWKNKIVAFYYDYKEYLLRGENRKQNLTILGSLIVVFLFILVTYPSYAIFKDEYDFSILGSKVGNNYKNEYDYTLLVYIEEVTSGIGNGKYNLSGSIPTFGYVYSGYKCENGSTLIYDEMTKLTSVTTNKRDTCSIYFDLTTNADLGITIMLEDRKGSNNYITSNVIPYYGYTYSHYECDNNSTLTYDSELHEAFIKSEGKEHCQLYFKKEETDIEVALFIENTYGKGDYIVKNSIPASKNYSLNKENSVCFNDTNERINTTISYTDGSIKISTEEIAYCEVYLKLENE